MEFRLSKQLGLLMYLELRKIHQYYLVLQICDTQWRSQWFQDLHSLKIYDNAILLILESLTEEVTSHNMVFGVVKVLLV